MRVVKLSQKDLLRAFRTASAMEHETNKWKMVMGLNAGDAAHLRKTVEDLVSIPVGEDCTLMILAR